MHAIIRRLWILFKIPCWNDFKISVSSAMVWNLKCNLYYLLGYHGHLHGSTSIHDKYTLLSSSVFRNMGLMFSFSTCKMVILFFVFIFLGIVQIRLLLFSSPSLFSGQNLSIFLKPYCCRFLIVIGVVLLVGSTRLVRHLPRPIRRGSDRNFVYRKSVSTRVREPSPSTIVQASTLQHLIASAKEKAWSDDIFNSCTCNV